MCLAFFVNKVLLKQKLVLLKLIVLTRKKDASLAIQTFFSIYFIKLEMEVLEKFDTYYSRKRDLLCVSQLEFLQIQYSVEINNEVVLATNRCLIRTCSKSLKIMSIEKDEWFMSFII